MKKLLTFLVLLTGGALVFAQEAAPDGAKKETAAQNAVTLDEAIKATAKAFNAYEWHEEDILCILPLESKVLSYESDNNGLSESIVKRLTTELTNSKIPVVLMNGKVTPNVHIRGKIVPGGDTAYEMTIEGVRPQTSQILVPPQITYIKKMGIDAYDTSWKTKSIYIGGRAGTTANIFNLNRSKKPYSQGKVDNNPNFSWNLAGEIAFQGKNNLLSFQVEFGITRSLIKWLYEGDSQEVYATTILLPMLYKPVFFVKNLYFSPFVGGYPKFSWGNYEFDEQSSSIKGDGDVSFDVMGGAVVGGDVGLKVGPGILFVDLRYLTDFGRTRPHKISPNEGESMIYGQDKGNTIYVQQMFMASLGYKIGLGSRK
ncbi:hypothetical protein FACS1894137_08010 [Spirochaetia bacterium]|nr:hypothetical protein FACS1894137_08010 [Spirochaetia bacterium]